MEKRQRLKKKVSPKSSYVFLFFLLCFLISVHLSDACAQVGDSSAVELKKNFVELMNRWVAFRWGLNCIVYVLYYDSSILDPWIELNAKLNGWDDVEKEEFKKSVMEALKVGKYSAFLVTIENLGKEPISLSPFSDKVFLEDSKGRKYKVSSYESQLDSPITGKVQGLVFFPLLSDDASRITFKMLGLPDGEASLSWELKKKEAVKAVKEEKKELTWEQIMASTPKGKEENKAKKEKIEVKVVKPSTKVKTPPKPNLPELPKSKKAYPPQGGKSSKVLEQPVSNSTPKIEINTDNKAIVNELGKKKTASQIVVEFLEAWKLKEYERMYSMLASPTREKMSLDEFKKLVEEKLPGWLKSGDWKMLPSKEKDGEARVSLISTIKLGFIRLLESYTFALTLEKEGWKVKF
ncbi:MAG: hypothetical protein PWQ16_682 [bacterium]|nr:hypothetical protein [bacterium]